MPLRPVSTAAFTLFEVALSLLIVTFAVVSILVLMPEGLKAQQMARFQIYAATKAEEMIEQFNSCADSNPAVDTEGLTMWDQPVAYKAQSWDLECRLSSHRFGLMPVPPDISRRLDSDGDEIKQILDRGGQLYYSQPLASTGTEEQGQAQSPPNEAQRVVIGVAGYAQQNSMTSFPLKNWPYHTPWPSPPLHMMHMADKFLPIRDYSKSSYYTYYCWPWEDWRQGGAEWASNAQESFCVPWETSPLNSDPDTQKVLDWPDDNTGVHCGYFPYACGRLPQWNLHTTQLTTADYGLFPSRPGVLRYVAAALWYAEKKIPGFAGSNTTPANPYKPSTLADTDRWKEVNAFRFLAHATTCLTAWYSYSSGEADDLTKGVNIPVISLANAPSPGNVKITHELIKYYHERSLYLINNFAASYPYDWAMPRSLNRVTMMDFPLIQADLFTHPLPTAVNPNPLYGADWNHIFGRGNLDYPMQWRAISPEPIQHVGTSATYPTSVINVDMISKIPASAGSSVPNPNSHFGNIQHYNLGLPFSAAERCRELVFWAVDWQSYEDFETAEGAPVDASKYPIACPRCDWHASGHSIPTSINRDYNTGRLVDMEFRDEQLWSYRNPEKVIMFYPNPGDPRQLPTGSDVSGYMVLNNPWTNYPDKGPSLQARMVFNGMYGADRNFNKKLDRGPVPKSVRLRATQVARFNFYDPRVQAIMR
jgi:hypothetical protein